MPSRVRPVRRWSGLVLVASLAGCGSGEPTIVEVTGTLTRHGAAVPSAEVHFVPDQGRPSWGPTDENGHFKLNYAKGQDGAVVGKHRVYVKMRPTTNAEKEAAMMGGRIPTSKDMAEFFDKYSAAKSTVEVVVDKNTKDLKLDWD